MTKDIEDVKILKKFGTGGRKREEYDNNKYFCNESFFETIDSHEKAYWFGFICADGNIYNQKLQMLSGPFFTYDTNYAHMSYQPVNKEVNFVKSELKPKIVYRPLVLTFSTDSNTKLFLFKDTNSNKLFIIEKLLIF